MIGDSKAEAASAGQGRGKRAGVPLLVIAVIAIIAILTVLLGAAAISGSNGPARVQGDGNETPVAGNPELYTMPVPSFYENGTQIVVTENRNATDPGYWQLLSFLADDDTDYGVYEPGHECTSFAVELNNHAEACHIKAHLVLIRLSNAPLHMIVAFDTADNGTVYVDDTGLTQEEIDDSVLVAPRIANVTVGSEYMWHYIDPYDFDADPGMGVVENVTIIS